MLISALMIEVKLTWQEFTILLCQIILEKSNTLHKALTSIVLKSYSESSELGAVINLIKDWDSWTRYASWRTILGDEMDDIRSGVSTGQAQRLGQLDQVCQLEDHPWPCDGRH